MDKIAVLDFGGQYTHLISETLRDRGYYAEVLPCETPASELRSYKGIVLSGGPKSVYDSDAPMPDHGIFSLGVPVFGICYGTQLMAQKLGGEVSRGNVREYGEADIDLAESQIFAGIDKKEKVWMSHGDSVTKVPEGFDPIATSGNGIVAAMADATRGIYGVQFHPEVKHTPKGGAILENFAYKVCHSSRDWKEENDIEDAIKGMRIQAKGRHVAALTSFGVDSSVSAKLAQLAFGDDVMVLYVSGLDRKEDPERAELLAKKMGMYNCLVIADGQEAFEQAVMGLPDPTDPEAKRGAIGDAYINIHDREVSMRGWDPDDTCTVQGSLYTDKIESGLGVGNKAARIKTHHNAGTKRIEEKRGKGLLIEPNEWKYKDGSRKRAAILGLPPEVVRAEPFPGPGLAVRMINGIYMPGDIERMYELVNEIASQYGLEGYVFPIRTVGVVGDERAFMNLAVLKGNPDFGANKRAAIDIVNKVRGVGRVAYSYGDSGLDQSMLMGIRQMPFSRKNMNLLRDIDYYVRKEFERAGYGIASQKIDQMPIVLFPGPKRHWVGIRPVSTENYMTADPVDIQYGFAMQLSEKLKELFDVEGFVKDLTCKPPGTIEWE